jgi:hypothetical protein
VNTGSRAGLAALLLACACRADRGPDGGQSGPGAEATEHRVDICDGSAGVRLRFAMFVGGTPLAWAPMMGKQGDAYVVVDGTCTFFAFSSSYPLYAWTPVVTGSLDAAALGQLGADLDIETWATLSDSAIQATEGCDFHSSRYDFYLAGDLATCTCCNPLAGELFFRASDAIVDLYSVGTRYEAPTLEAFVFRPYGYYETVPNPAQWSVEWGAEQTPESLQAWPVMDRYAELGTVVTEADRPWFAAVQAGFQDRDLSAYPRTQDGIDVVGDLETSFAADWQLFIRSIVP